MENLIVCACCVCKFMCLVFCVFDFVLCGLEIEHRKEIIREREREKVRERDREVERERETERERERQKQRGRDEMHHTPLPPPVLPSFLNPSKSLIFSPSKTCPPEPILQHVKMCHILEKYLMNIFQFYMFNNTWKRKTIAIYDKDM